MILKSSSHEINSDYENMHMTFINKPQQVFMQTKMAFTRPAIIEETASEQEYADEAF